MHTKNNGPIIYASDPITLNTCANTTKASPLPSVTTSLNAIPLVIAMKPNIENIPTELNTSKEEFENATTKALLTNFDLSGR